MIQEEARRRQLGLAVAGDDDYDPFDKQGSDNDDDPDETGAVERGPSKESVSWSYSQYIQGLDAEDVLNNVDERTFDSLSSEKLPPGETWHQLEARRT